MPRTFLDHIAITAFSLEAGAALVADTLGVETQRGGEHPRMATHNRLLRLGESIYLEVIAPNPAARSPGRPRWFGLDTLAPHALPALSAWVVRSTDIQASAAAASEPLGDLEPMRRSALDWLITIPADGSVPLEGAAPALIQWHADAHPATRMEDKGCALALLEIFHLDPERISRLLSSLELEAPVAVRQAGPGDPVRLAAHIDTPHGRRIL